MPAPQIEAEPFMTLEVELDIRSVGTTPYGEREEVWFEGTATSTMWSGERAVSGIDHIKVSSTGTATIDVHTMISGDGEVITYRGNGRATERGVREGVIFETSCERLAWLNDLVAVGKGTLVGDHLTIELYRMVD